MSRRRARGQSTVEFALLVPVVLAALLLLVQVALIMHAHIALTHVAREVARASAVDPDVDIGQVIDRSTTLSPDDMGIEVIHQTSSYDGNATVLVHLSYKVPVVSVLFEPILGDFQVHAQVSMMAEI